MDTAASLPVPQCHVGWHKGFRGMLSAVSRWLFLATLIASVCFVPTASAQEATNLLSLSFDELLEIRVDKVYGASRFVQDVQEAPASVSIITSDDVKKFGYTTIGDAVRAVRGMYVIDDRNYAFLGIRGFSRAGDYNSRVLLLVDGHRINDNIYDAALYGQEAVLDVDLIDRIEVIRGPSSSIYGSSAFFGVVNVVTRRAADIAGGEVSASAGSLDTYKARFTLGTNFSNGLEWVVSGSLFESRGEEKIRYREFRSSPSRGVVRNSDEDQAANAYTSLRYGDFTLSSGFSAREKNVPTASFGTVFGDGRQETLDLRGYVDLSYKHTFENDTHLVSRVYYDESRYRGLLPYEYTPGTVTLNRDASAGTWVGGEVLLNRTFFDSHTVVAGLEHRESLRQEQSIYDLRPRVAYLDDDRTSRNTGVYLEDEYRLTHEVRLNAGVRYDYYSTYGGSVSPRAGVIYSVTTNSTFKLLYGRAFRAPNAYELYYDPATKHLRAETIDTYELVYEQKLPGELRLTSSSFYYQIENALTEVANGGSISYKNVRGAEALGQELELERRWAHALARASYAVQWAGESDTHRELVNSPRHLAKLNVSVPVFRDKVFGGLEVQYYGRTLTVARRNSGDFALVNFTLFSRELVKGLEASATIYNLFDTDYGYPGSSDHLQDVLPQNGRGFRLKLTYRF